MRCTEAAGASSISLSHQHRGCEGEASMDAGEVRRDGGGMGREQLGRRATRARKALGGGVAPPDRRQPAGEGYRCPCSPQPVSPPEAQLIWPGPSTARPGPNRARAGPARSPCPGLDCHPSPWAGTARHGVSRPARYWPANSNGQACCDIPKIFPNKSHAKNNFQNSFHR